MSELHYDHRSVLSYQMCRSSVELPELSAPSSLQLAEVLFRKTIRLRPDRNTRFGRLLEQARPRGGQPGSRCLGQRSNSEPRIACTTRISISRKFFAQHMYLDRVDQRRPSKVAVDVTAQILAYNHRVSVFYVAMMSQEGFNARHSPDASSDSF